jgi:glycine oxidase
MHDVVVVGGGVIGLSIARELIRDRSVLLLDRGDVGEGTSWAAAGILSPQSEADYPNPFFNFCMASLKAFRSFADELRFETGIDPEYSDEGLLLLASSEDQLKTLQSRFQWQRAAGLSVDILTPGDVSKMEPRLTVEITGALLLPADHQVAPRRLVKALRESCLNRGVEIRTGIKVDSVAHEHGSIQSVRAGNVTFQAPTVIIASGVWTRDIAGLTPAIPVIPRKGQILSLGMQEPMFKRVVRWEHGYFVPRRDRQLVLGATDEDVGFDRALTPAGLGHLLMDAQRISSYVGALPILETWTGLRPATPDGLPILGQSSIRGLFYATGHYRNGILLAPITASVISALVRDTRPSIPVETFSPFRFKV